VGVVTPTPVENRGAKADPQPAKALKSRRDDVVGKPTNQLVEADMTGEETTRQSWVS
jgi:hypothetical protein